MRNFERDIDILLAKYRNVPLSTIAVANDISKDRVRQIVNSLKKMQNTPSAIENMHIYKGYTLLWFKGVQLWVVVNTDGYRAGHPIGCKDKIHRLIDKGILELFDEKYPSVATYFLGLKNLKDLDDLDI